MLPAVRICPARMSRWPIGRDVYNRRPHQALHLGWDPRSHRRRRGRGGVVIRFRLTDDIDLIRLKDFIRPSHADMAPGEGTSKALGSGPGASLTGWSCFRIYRRL